MTIKSFVKLIKITINSKQSALYEDILNTPITQT